MELRRIKESEFESAYALLASNGWSKRLHSPAEFASLVSASQIANVAVVNNEIVGFVRALTDGQSNGYLSMLVVTEGRRRQGIGRALVEQILEDNPRITWVLRVGRAGAPEFFSKLGFEFSSLAMERRRASPDA
jgi:ribosomal protein S18 acetylase RimI-like enzyme